jgi:hypothetical protein
MPNISVFDELSPEEIQAIDDEIIRRNFKKFSDISDWCKENGWEIERGAVWTRAQKVKKNLQIVKMVTQEAIQIKQSVKDEGGDLHDATLSLIQARLYKSVSDLVESDLEENPELQIELLGKAARASSDISRSSVNVKKWKQEIEAKAAKKALEEAAKRVDAAAKAQGLDETQARFWREKVLMGGV